MPPPPAEPELRLRKVDWRTLDSETIVLDLATDRYLRLNRSGTVLWEEVAAGATRTRLVATLAERFRIDGDRAADDVDAFLAELRSHGLLEDPVA